MKKLFTRLIIIPILAIIAYLFSALYSTHQIHKGIYYNDKALLKEYIEWNQLRENFKNYLNVNLLKEIQKDEDFKNLGSLGVLITGFASKIVDSILDTYVNSEGLSMLLQENQMARKLPKPDFNTLLGGIKIMEFKNHSSFRINHKVDKKEISILFQRIGIDWKITQIEFPEDLLNEFKKSNLNKIKPKKKKNKSKQLTSSEINILRRHVSNCWNVPYSGNDLKDLIKVKISANPDGSVINVEIMNIDLYKRDPIYRAVADSARNAVKECSPLPLPKDKYEAWKTFVFNFDTSFIN